MEYTCERIDLPGQPTLAVRSRAPVDQLNVVLGPLWGKVMAHASSLPATPAGPPYVAYHNMDMQDLDLEVGFPFGEALPGSGDVVAGEIPAGPAVQTIHRGPYENISEGYVALRSWLEEHGHEPAGPAYEHYLNDPAEVAPEELLTRLVWPIR